MDATPKIPARAPGEVVRLPLLEGGLMPAAKLLQIGELARLSGKTVRAIHHYEELGLLKPDSRSRGRFRLYDASAVVRIRWIGKLHDLGMSLTEIKRVVEEWVSAESPARAMSRVREMYARKLEQTRVQIAHLAQLERELVASVSYLDTCDSCDPAVLPEATASTTRATDEACGPCQLREREAEPDLVAGIVA